MKVIILILFISFLSSVQSAEIKVLFSKGKNYKISGTASSLLKKGEKLEQSDLVKTANNGLVILKIKNHSVIRIEERSEVRISELPYFFQDDKEIEKPGSLLLEMGSMIIEMDKSFNNESLKVKTNDAVLGVRGTRFFVAQDGEGTILSVDKGLVEVVSSKTDLNDFVEKSESISVSKNGFFSGRQKFNFQRSLNWNVTDRKLGKTFNYLRSSIRKELREKKKKWKLDRTRRDSFKKKWQNRKNLWKQKTRKLKSKLQSFKRERKLEKKNTRLKDNTLKREERVKRKKLQLRNKNQQRRNKIQQRKQQVDNVRRRIRNNQIKRRQLDNN